MKFDTGSLKGALHGSRVAAIGVTSSRSSERPSICDVAAARQIMDRPRSAARAIRI